MVNNRSIVGKDLLNLFTMIEKYGITENVHSLLVNIVANLQTIESVPINMFENFKEEVFEEINEKTAEKEKEIKKKIIKKFMHILNKNNEAVLRKDEVTLSPLSKIMADVFEEYTDEEVLVILPN